MFAMLCVPCVLILKVRTATKIGRSFFGGIVWKEATVRVQVNFHKLDIPDAQKLQRGINRIAGSIFADSPSTNDLYLPVMPLEFIESRYVKSDGTELPDEVAQKYLPPRKEPTDAGPRWFCYKLSSILSMTPA